MTEEHLKMYNYFCLQGWTFSEFKHLHMGMLVFPVHNLFQFNYIKSFISFEDYYCLILAGILVVDVLIFYFILFYFTSLYHLSSFHFTAFSSLQKK